MSSRPQLGSQLDELIQGRRSVRAYTDQPVQREDLLDMIKAAGWAPSPHGRQPWRFVILTQQTLKERLADAMGVDWQRNLEMDGQDPEIVAIRLQKSRDRLLKAPALIIPCLYLEDLDVYPDPIRQGHETTMAVQSIGSAIQNMLLLAYDRGLDTGWMCAPLFCPEIVVEALGLAETLIPQALITVGYAAADPKRRGRRPLEQMLVRFDNEELAL